MLLSLAIRSDSLKISYSFQYRGVHSEVAHMSMQVAVALLAHLDDRNQHTRSRIAAHLCTCITKSSSYFAQPGQHPFVHQMFLHASPCSMPALPSARLALCQCIGLKAYFDMLPQALTQYKAAYSRRLWHAWRRAVLGRGHLAGCYYWNYITK